MKLDVGFTYEEGLGRAKNVASQKWGDKKTQANLINGIVNQVKIAEGQESANAIVTEVTKTMKNPNWHDNAKSRPQGFTVDICIRDCEYKNSDVCSECMGPIGSSSCMYKPIKEGE